MLNIDIQHREDRGGKKTTCQREEFTVSKTKENKKRRNYTYVRE